MASNVQYHFENGIGYGKLPDGTTFVFDEECFDRIRPVKWYISLQGGTNPRPYLIDRSGRKMHTYLIRCPKGYEVDHISLDTLDNRKSNLRICTHQQNQCNQPLQCNNTSGVSGVSFYAPRGKYRARIKIGQHDIHLGYYSTFAEAVQARNVGMECMFGEYGRYNDAAPEPAWIRTKATEQCRRFAELSLCKAFRLCGKSQKGGDSYGDGRKKAEAHGAEGAGRRPGQGAAAAQRA